MKTVYLIGGTMGVGKTTLCQYMKQHLDHSVFLDGDWCWDSHPFVVNESTKKMVRENICFLLNQFIHEESYKHIIFAWVMHEQSIIDDIVSHLDLKNCQLKVISLVCEKEVLKEHILYDVKEGKRNIDVLERSLQRLPLYDLLNSQKVDITNKSLETIIAEIVK